jgi:apolipoprotein D and lipocalin family protein
MNRISTGMHRLAFFPIGLLAAAALAGIAGCAASGPPLEVVNYVDLDRYAGTWYEIARYPASFQEGCVGVTAEYTMRDDGRIDVVNRCFEESFDGPQRSVEGVARVVDEQTNARLKVTFFWPFEGDYYIIDLDEDYQWAVVGEPSRKYLWILSRTPTLDEAVYQSIISRLPERNYDPARLQITPQQVPTN